MEDLLAVEEADVARLRRREATDGPAQMNEVRLDRVGHRMHADLRREVIALARVAGRAGRHDVGPVVGATSGQRDQVVAGQRLAWLEIRLHPAAVLTAIVVAREEERVRDLATEAARDVDELHQPDDRWARQSQPFRSNDALTIRLHDFRLPVDDEAERAAHRNHGQRLERRVQSQATDDQTNLPRVYTNSRLDRRAGAQ